MSLPLKKVVQYVTKQKHLKRYDLCREDIPVSTFHRWLNNSNIDLINLETLLSRLHLTWSEFNYLLHYDQEKLTYNLQNEIILAYQKRQLERLEAFQKICYKYEQHYINDNFLHLNNLITIFIADLTKKDYPNYEDLPLIQYLLSNDFWTNYEFSFVNHILVIIPFALAEKLYQKIKQQELERNHFLYKQYLRLDINFAFAAIYHRELSLAKKIIQKLERAKIPETYLFDKITIHLLLLVWRYIIQPGYYNRKAITEYLKIIKELNCPNLYKILYHLTNFVFREY